MQIPADAAGMDPQRLSRVGRHLRERYVEPGLVSGCQVAVVRHGAVACFESLGRRDRERGAPVTEDTIWRIYSMTKPVTGVALLTLYERGLFRLDDPVHRFIPEWEGLKVRVREPDGTGRLVDPHRPMNVRDLLAHTSGLGIAGLRQREDTTLAEMVVRLAERPLRFHPGTHWLYTVSTDVCGRLVEILSGRRLDEYLESEIFAPLGMDDTGFTVDDEKAERFAAAYRRGRNGGLDLMESQETSPFRRERLFLSGGGGLVSTTGDYLRFCRMLLNGGELDGVRVLGRKTVELMTANHLPGGAEIGQLALPGAYGETGFEGMGFGLTVAVNVDPVRTAAVGSAGEYMWGGAASTLFWVDPAEELIVVFMTQLLPWGTHDFRGDLKALVYSAISD